MATLRATDTFITACQGSLEPDHVEHLDNVEKVNSLGIQTEMASCQPCATQAQSCHSSLRTKVPWPNTTLVQKKKIPGRTCAVSMAIFCTEEDGQHLFPASIPWQVDFKRAPPLICSVFIEYTFFFQRREDRMRESDSLTTVKGFCITRSPRRIGGGDGSCQP